MDKTGLTIAGLIIFVVVALFGTINYCGHLKYECTISAMQNKYDSASIQAICKV